MPALILISISLLSVLIYVYRSYSSRDHVTSLSSIRIEPVSVVSLSEGTTEPVPPNADANDLSNLSYPADLIFRYYLQEGSPLYGRNAYYTTRLLQSPNGTSEVSVYALSKVADGYEILEGADQGFVISVGGDLGYSEIFHLEHANGTFALRFDDEPTLRVYLDTSHGIVGSSSWTSSAKAHARARML